jgi:tetratricopeptide (TPR) repeat protein
MPPENAYRGRFAEVMRLIREGRVDEALAEASDWRREQPGDVLAVVALGEALEAAGDLAMAARAYGSLIDLYPSRADMRRMAGERLERLHRHGLDLAVDTYRHAVEQRPDHPTGHRLYAYALLKTGHPQEAFEALLEGARREYPSGRFRGVEQVLREDLALIAAAWLAMRPEDAEAIRQILKEARVHPDRGRSVRFVLNWETDANDVDFHVYDGRGGHAYYSDRELESGGELYADVTTGYGPECFTVRGGRRGYPYWFQAHYYSRGPMGYGMGKLEIIAHDGRGTLRFAERPFVIMRDNAYVNLGKLTRKTDLEAVGPGAHTDASGLLANGGLFGGYGIVLAAQRIQPQL